MKKSSRSISRVPFSASKCKVSVIYLHSLSPVSSSGLPSDVGRATLVNAGLHDLTTPKMHSPHIAIRLVGSYPTFSPLPPGGGGYFLLHYSTLTDSFLLGSRMLCVARTFLFYYIIMYQRQTDRLLSSCKGTQINGICAIIVRILLIRVFGELSERAGRIVSVVTISLVMNVNLSDMPVNCG